MKPTHSLIQRGTLAIAATAALCSPSGASDNAFSSPDNFDMEPGGRPPIVLDFDSFSSGQSVVDLLSGFVTPRSGSGVQPTVFWGSWGCVAVGGGGLIPEPRFTSEDLVLEFASPVFGIGSQVFDDFDGIPSAAHITLTAHTTTGGMIQITETTVSNGCAGFLGATSNDGIIKAVFSISNSGGNLELDYVRVRPFSDLNADVDSISLASGGEQRLFSLAGPAFAGSAYVTLGTVSGTTPGFNAFGTSIPLNYDAYTNAILSRFNSPPLLGSLGTLDPHGSAVTRLVIPAGSSMSLLGLEFHHASIVLDVGPLSIRKVSNPVALRLEL